MATKAGIIAKAAGAYDKVRPKMAPGVRCFLLMRSPNSSALTAVAEITSGFWVRWNSFREQMRFNLPDENEARIDEIGQTSYIGYGVPDTDGEIDVFAISFESRDRIAPDGSSPFWKLFGERKKEIRFAVPE